MESPSPKVNQMEREAHCSPPSVIGLMMCGAPYIYIYILPQISSWADAHKTLLHLNRLPGISLLVACM
jgi:hypothetical protein